MDEGITLTDFKREFAVLATLRDELKLKAHLAHAELRTELDDLERRWLLVDEQLQRSKRHLEDDGANIAENIAALLRDLKLGYQNARRAFDADA